MYNFEGRKIIVTGAGRNTGREIAASLARAGAKVYALDCWKEGLDALVNELPSISPIYQDLENWEETKRVINELDQVDGLVNCAAICLKLGNVVTIPKEDLEKTLNVNLLAPINLMQEVGKKMISAGKGGSIVNISSQLGELASPGMLAYSVAKAGLNMATKQFALELGPHNIRVNAVGPGMVKTDMLMNLQTPETIQAGISKTPLRRICEMEDVVKYVLFLLSDESKMVSGTFALVDGGHSCQTA